MGPQEEYIETVVTCEGDYYDPEFHTHLQNLSKRLQNLLTEGDHKLIVKKVEPWNSVRVTFNIPKEAAVRLKQLAEQGDRTLRELGVLAVQIEGHRLISLTIAGKNNETTELVLQTSGTAAAASAGSVFDLPGTDEINIPGPSNVESTRRNIAQYLREQGGPGNLFDSLFSPNFLDNLKPTDTVGAAAQGHQNPLFAQFPFGLRGVPDHSSGTRLPLRHEQLPLPPGFPPGSFPSPSLPHSQAFSSPTTSHNQSPLSPNYPTPPPSVSNPSSPGSRTANFNNLALSGMNTAAALSSLPRLLGNRDITSSSPLLVNLLQNDIGGLAHLNNLMPSKVPGMPFSLSDMGQPPVKRRRKPRKPKPDAAKSRSPAGQEVQAGTSSSIPSAPGTCDAQQDKLPARCLPDQHVLKSRMDNLGQFSQEMDVGASVAAVTTVGTPVISRPTPSGNCVSPGQALSPRGQSPRTQSPVCAQSPGWSKTQGTFGNNPPHIVNPVTGQLEPAACMELSANEHSVKDGSMDSDDMAHIQLQPPPNPLVELNKDITASKEVNLEVPSISTSSQKQSSPKAIISATTVHTQVVDCVDVISEQSASVAQNKSASTSSATSVTCLNGHTDRELVRNNTACGPSHQESASSAPSLPSSEKPFVSSTPASPVTSSVSSVTDVIAVSTPFTTSLVTTVMTTGETTTVAATSLHTCTTVTENSSFSSSKLVSHSASSSTVLPPSAISNPSLLTTGGCRSDSSSTAQPLTVGSHSPVDSLPSSVSSSDGTLVMSSAPTGATSLGPPVQAVQCITTASTTRTSSEVASPKNGESSEMRDIVMAQGTDSTEEGHAHLLHNASDSPCSQHVQAEQTPTTSTNNEIVPTSDGEVTLSSGIVEQEGVSSGNPDSCASPTDNMDVTAPVLSPLSMPKTRESTEQQVPAVQDDPAYHLCTEDNVFIKSAGESSSDNELVKTEKSEQGTALVNCESPDPVLSNATPEHSGTDGSNTSSITGHSQGKDSGIADVGHGILGSISCLVKSEDAHNDTPELGRSNGASTSEASPLSETDTISSGHLSRSPSVRLTSSTGLANHDSELSSHSFDDHVCSASVDGNDISEVVPQLPDSAADHDAVEEELADGQSVKADLHRCSSMAGDKNVITVGYALSKDQPTVDLSLSGLSDKSLPFLTEPSNVFEKDNSSVTLKEFALGDSFHAANNVQKKKKVALAHSPLNNGEAQAKDCLNWSKMLSLSPVVLGKSDLDPGNDETNPGLKNSVIPSAMSVNGDTSVPCSASENSVCKVSLTVVDIVDAVVTLQDQSASADSNHAMGILDTASDNVTSDQGTGSLDPLQCDLVSEMVESVSGDTRPEHDDSIKMSPEPAAEGTETVASPSIATTTENGACAVSTSSSMDGVSSLTTGYSPKAQTSTVITLAVTSCCTSVSGGAHSPVSALVKASLSGKSPVSTPVAIPATVTCHQDVTQTNTFGASMVTTIVTSAVSMGSVLSTSFSVTPSSAAIISVPFSAQQTPASFPGPVIPSLPITMSSTQELKTTPSLLHLPTSAATQLATSHSVSVSFHGPHQPGESHQQTGPRIVAINNGVHIDSVPPSASLKSLKPCPTTYTVHSHPVADEDHGGVGQQHGNLTCLPLVQPVANCVSSNANHPAEKQQTQLVIASLPPGTHVVSQRPSGEVNDLHIGIAKVTNMCHNTISRTVSSCETHAAVGVQPETLQLDPALCPAKYPDTVTETKCSKDSHTADQEKSDCKPSRGISIMKPLYDREWEIEEELHPVASESKDDGTVQKVIKLDPPVMEELHPNQLHTNQLSNIVLPKAKSPFTIAQILEEADKQRRNQAQLKQKALLPTQSDCAKPDIPVLNDSLNISSLSSKSIFHIGGVVNPVKATKTTFSAVSASPSVKSLVSNLDLGKNAGSHLANFVQKSLQTPVLFNSAPHPITSPGFPLNLTESVKKVMNAIPRTDTTPPPSPVYNKGPSTLPTPVSPSRLRANSTSPVAHGTGNFPHTIHKRNADPQGSFSLELSGSGKPGNTTDINHAFTDKEGTPHVPTAMDTVRWEKCTEMAQNVCSNSCSDTSLQATELDAEERFSAQDVLTTDELKLKAETVDQASLSKKTDGSGDDSFSSEHSYSAKPPGTLERPAKDNGSAQPSDSPSVLDTSNLQNENGCCDHDIEKCEPAISLMASPACELSIVTSEQESESVVSPKLCDPTSPLSTDSTVVIASSISQSSQSGLTLTERLNKALPISKTDGSGKIHMISPVRPILTTRDDREGTSQTLVIKIVGAHATPKEISPGVIRSDAKVSAVPAVPAKESSVIDLSGMMMCQKPANGDGCVMNDVTRCTKRKSSISDSLESGCNHEPKAPKTETDCESVRSLSPVTDELGSLFQKRRSPSIDALSETSSTDGHLSHSQRAESVDRLDSSAPKPTRMSTRNHGRRRNSPSDSSSDTPVKDDKSDSSTLSNAVKPSVVTRGSKRRLNTNHDDDLNVHEKKIRIDQELSEAGSMTKQMESKAEDTGVPYSKNKSNVGSACSLCSKISAKVIAAKGKANSSHDLTPATHEEKQKGRKASAKGNEVSKEESSSGKRGQKNKLPDPRDDNGQQGKLDQKDEPVDTKGKRTTRSSRTKDHCELPNAALLKRRRSSRDHR